VLTVVPRALGPRVGGAVQQVIKAVKAGEWTLSDGHPVAAGVALQEGEYELRLMAADADHSAPLPGGEGVVVLDTEVTPDLAAEGLARDVVRVVQQARRDAALDVADRITLVVDASAEVTAAVRAHAAFVAREVLANSVEFGSPAGGAGLAARDDAGMAGRGDAGLAARGDAGVAGRDDAGGAGRDGAGFGGEVGDGEPVRVFVARA
jgi:isoleucyl-tRNA synthetase